MLVACLLPVAGTASELNPRWSAQRTESNALGDAVSNGDQSAIPTLMRMAKQDKNAPAAHNLGWIYQFGYAGDGQDMVQGCKWYEFGATLGYPPSMHSYARLCLMVQSAGPGSGDLGEVLALEYLLSATEAGWVPSAITYAEHMLNQKTLGLDDMPLILAAIDTGLANDPNEAEKITLSYLYGASAVFGLQVNNPNALETARKAEARLLHAAKANYADADSFVPKLRGKWLGMHIRQMAAWAPPIYDLETCVDNINSETVDRPLAQNCYGSYRDSVAQLTEIQRDGDYLSTALDDQPNLEELAYQHTEFKSLIDPFPAEIPLWENQFITRYVARSNADAWGQ